MFTDAFAQGAAAGPAPDPNKALLLQLPYFAIIFVIIYFMLIRPQRQKQKQMDTMLKALKKGDRVLTSGGIFGTVIGVDEAKAVLRIAENVKVEVSKSAIVQVVGGEAA